METTNHEIGAIAEETTTAEEPKLYAGKYKSVGELEKAYKNSATVFNENKTLKEKLKSHEVPENYSLPDVSLPENVLKEMQSLAKTARLSQEQFNKTLTVMQEQQQQEKARKEERKKLLGDNFKIAEDYVTKNYLPAFHNPILNTLLGDEIAMSDAMKHREQLLNSQVPGLGSQRANLTDSDDGKNELLKIAAEYRQNPNDKNRKRYINIASEVADAKRKH
ncbi:hypothetical protein [Rickettsiella endosymbiont of Dermanyssus gallinae]|uniref:hypothetical protein n=1 Tax=Rickettsiella endosymbiont of Dermanyssus gallinae TaxID=2856608 RepID=UPI001FE8EF69|nr:hypothetical protein [Rickettsiella endosymbiont of Dermanyssus gallinae]